MLKTIFLSFVCGIALAALFLGATMAAEAHAAADNPHCRVIIGVAAAEGGAAPVFATDHPRCRPIA